MKDSCKICKGKAESSFNINFKLVPICENCAATIFLQQATWYKTKMDTEMSNIQEQNDRMKTWFEKRTGLKDKMLSEQMKCIDKMLK